MRCRSLNNGSVPLDGTGLQDGPGGDRFDCAEAEFIAGVLIVGWLSSSAATISSGHTPAAGSSKTTSIETDGSVRGSPSESGQCTSYSVKPVPRCPHRRVSAIRTASTI